MKKQNNLVQLLFTHEITEIVSTFFRQTLSQVLYIAHFISCSQQPNRKVQCNPHFTEEKTETQKINNLPKALF